MGKSSFGAILTAGLLSLVLASPASARVSLNSIEQQLEAILTGIGEPTKIFLSGELLESANSISGPELAYTIPDNKRLFLREISCRASGYTSVLNDRRFSMTIQATLTSPSSKRQNIVSTEFRTDRALLLSTIMTTTFESNTYLDAGDRMQLYLSRRGTGNDGSIGFFECVLTGYMTDK